jgi:hypothetical protein
MHIHINMKKIHVNIEIDKILTHHQNNTPQDSYVEHVACYGEGP